MSRFFHGGLSDSETSSSDEELYSEEEEEEDEGEESGSDEVDEESDESDESATESGAVPANRASRFLRTETNMTDEDDDDDGRRVVKSAKDKRFEEIESCIKLIENAEKINDWAVISQEFDKLNKLISKFGSTATPPKSYIKTVADLEDFMNETLAKEKTAAKKMNATNARALNSIKQRLKRNNRQYDSQIEIYRSDKEAYMVENEDQDLEVPVRPGVPAPIQPSATFDDQTGFETVGPGGRTLSLTAESIFKHLKVIIESRGKKNTDRGEQIKTMERLLEVAKTPYEKIKVLLALISTRFDLSSGVLTFMALDQWKSAEAELNILIDVLDSDHSWIVTEIGDDIEDDEKAPSLSPGQVFKIPGSIVSFVDRLDDELTRSLQHIDPHTTEYIDRLGDEGALYKTIVRSQLYFERISKLDNLTAGTNENLNRVIMRRLEHLYYKPASVISKVEENTWKSISLPQDSTISERFNAEFEPNTLVQTICSFLYTHDSTIIRTRAMLCHIYYLALQNRFFLARDMLLMSHLQENIHNADISTQILYNRTLVQVGLCAFRAGYIFESQSCLQEICGTGRLKELLAQGVQIQKYSQITPEQERLEKQRQLPFHMHINLELLESAYLTSSMLLEIPALAAMGSSPDIKKKVISKTFRRMLEYHERQIFTGPPENTRDHVMQAAKALAAGDWKRCQELIHSIKIWDLLPNTDEIKAMLSEKIQEEGLRTYLFTYAPFYDTLSIVKLAAMFDISERKVSSLVSRMIAQEEISAALDQVKDVIIFRKGVEMSRLQNLALALSEKASGLIELNERVYEQKTQGTSNTFTEQGAPRGQGGGRGGKGRGDHSGRGGAGGRGGGGGRGRGGSRNVQFSGDRNANKS